MVHIPSVAMSSIDIRGPELPVEEGFAVVGYF